MPDGPLALETQTERVEGDDDIVVVAPEPRASEPPTLLLLVVFTVLASVMTFRNVSRLRTFIPGNRGDAFLNLWIIRSVQTGLPHGWNAFWNAGIFHPAPNTLAYSDTLLPVALVHWPLRLVLGDVLALNLILLSAFVLSSWCTYRLARRVAHHWGAAFVAALAYSYATIRLVEDGHMQLVAGGALVPLAILLLFRLLEAPSIGRAVAVGVAMIAVTLTASYYGVMTAVMVAVIGLGWLLTAARGARMSLLRGLAAAAVVALVLVVPFGVQYWRLQQNADFRRPFVTGYGLHVNDVFSASQSSYVLTHFPIVRSRTAQIRRTDENRVFPGLITGAFGVLGLAVLVRAVYRRGPRTLRKGRDRILILLGVAGVACVILAIGDYVHIGSTRINLPFYYLRAHAPGFAGIRAVARFMLGAQLALVLFAAAGIDVVLRRLRRGYRVPVVIVLAVLVCVETATPLSFVRVPTSRDDGGFAQALEQRRAGVVAELPIASAANGPVWPFGEAPRQLLAINDGNPRVNGYSGFQPTGFDDSAKALNDFPSPSALYELRKRGVRYVILRTALVGGRLRGLPALSQNGVGKYTEATAHDMLQRIPPGVARSVAHLRGGYLIELNDAP